MCTLPTTFCNDFIEAKRGQMRPPHPHPPHQKNPKTTGIKRKLKMYQGSQELLSESKNDQNAQVCTKFTLAVKRNFGSTLPSEKVIVRIGRRTDYFTI